MHASRVSGFVLGLGLAVAGAAVAHAQAQLRDGGAGATQHRPAGKMFPGDEHSLSPYLMSAACLMTGASFASGIRALVKSSLSTMLVRSVENL